MSEHTCQVIPKRIARNAEGKACSVHGTIPPGYTIRTEGFTLKIESRDGTVTYGHHRIRGTVSEADAVRIAQDYASATGAKYKGVAA